MKSLVGKLHSFAEGNLAGGEPIQIDLIAEFQRLAELVQGSGASPLSIRFEDEGRPLVWVPQMPLRLLLLNLLGHFTQRRTRSNRILIRTGRAAPHMLLELVDPVSDLPPRELESMLSPDPANAQAKRPATRNGLAVAAELAREIGGELGGKRLADQGFSLSLLLPEAGAEIPVTSTAGG